MDNVEKIFAEREQAASGERRAVTECFDKYSQAVNDIEQVSLSTFTYSLCKLDLQLHADRMNWARRDRMTAYFQSSPYKAALSRLMTLARYDKWACTVKYISDRICVSRVAAHTFVNDCLAEKWIISVQMSNKSLGYWASDSLMDAMEKHSNYISDSVKYQNVDEDGEIYRMSKRRKDRHKAALHSNQY